MSPSLTPRASNASVKTPVPVQSLTAAAHWGPMLPRAPGRGAAPGLSCPPRTARYPVLRDHVF